MKTGKLVCVLVSFYFLFFFWFLFFSRLLCHCGSFFSLPVWLCVRVGRRLGWHHKPLRCHNAVGWRLVERRRGRNGETRIFLEKLMFSYITSAKTRILFFLVLYKCNYRNHVNTNKKSRTTNRTSHDKDYTLLTCTRVFINYETYVLVHSFFTQINKKVNKKLNREAGK